nr:retrovirus-related Pol polyprotein from transposon TNT 1-94 [Tanacetum cinerariifolium]
MSRDVLIVGSTMRIPLLYRGEYSQWVERFINYLEEQTDGEAMINSIKNDDKPLPHITQVLQPEWKQYATMMRQNKNLMDINIDALYNILKQNQGGVNDAMGLKKKTVVVTYDPLALIAEKTKVSKSKEKAVVSSKSEGTTNNNLRISSTSQSANKKQEFVKTDNKKVEKKDDEKKRDMSRVKCYNCKKEGHFTKDCKKVKVKDYEYYKTKMLLAKKHKDEQVLVAEDQAWMESSSDSDQEINANMVFMAQIEKVLSDSEASSSPADEKISKKTSSLKPYVPNVILEKIIIDLEDEVVSLLEKEKANLKTIESLKSKGFESSENAISESKNQSKNDCHVVEKECDKVENSKVIAPGMFKLSVSQSVSPISMSKTSRDSKNVENLDIFSSVKRPKNSVVIWKKKGSSNTSNVDFFCVSVSKLNKNVKRYSRKDLLSCNNSHLGETSSAYVCNDVMNVSCNSRMCDLFDENNLFIFDDESVRIYPVRKMPFRKKPRDSMNIVQICLWIIDSGCSKHMTVIEKVGDSKENPNVIAPGMFKLSVSQSVSLISVTKTSCASNSVENLDTLSGVRRPKPSGVMWMKKGSSKTVKADLSSVNHSNLNKNVKRYSRKNLMACNNFDTRSAFDCNNARNALCNAIMNASVDVNDLFVFDDIVQICLWIIDSGCSKHMTGNRALLMNFVEKFLGTVRFGKNDFAVIAGYEDVVIGSMTIKKVYYVKGLGHNLFSIGQFFDKGLEVAFQKSTCFVRNEDDVDLLTDEASEVITSFIKKTQVNLQLQVQRVRTDNGTKFKNKTLAKFFDEVGITQQFSAARTPQQNDVVERRNQTLVEAARNMLTFANLPLFLWAEAIATACFTQNILIIHKHFDKTPYELMNKRKPNIKFFRVFGCRCYLFNHYDDFGKLKTKRDIGVFVIYSKESASSRIYNKRTRKMHESVNVNFDEIFEMASKQFSLEPSLSNLNETRNSSNPSIMKSSTMNVETSNVEISLHEEEVFHESFESFKEESSSYSLNDDVQQRSEEVRVPSSNTQLISNNIVPNFDEVSTSHNVFNERLKDAYFVATESDYVAVSGCCAQMLWIRTQLMDYGFFYDKVPIYCDSKSAIAILCNPVQHTRTKHIDMRYHFIKDHVEKGTTELYFIGTEYQLADLFTKSLPEARFKFLVEKLGMMSRET